MDSNTVVGTMTGWLSESDCDIDDFAAVVEQRTELSEYPHAVEVRQNVLVYGPDVQAVATASAVRRRAVQAELARALREGPGIVVFSGAFTDTAVIDRATLAFEALIEQQRASGAQAGDHFAKPGMNDRIWGALDKFAAADPEGFAAYYANDVIALTSEAWLGRNYQVTSQVNVVNPGASAQTAHRDYHLGFMDQQHGLEYPRQVHLLSPALTLQGAVAHCDMPVTTGPTKYLPHSQKYESGYVAFHRPEFTAYFEANFVQLPLAKGDAAFFNPALFHGAGTNRSTYVRRMANLLQISSAFGRAMESVDRTAICEALYPVLGTLPEAARRNVVAASAEGYPFPTNLDRDAPVGGLAPQTQADLVHQALAEGWDAGTFGRALRAQEGRRQTEGASS